MRKHRLLGALLAGCIAACAPFALDTARLDPARNARPSSPVRSERPLIALALGGGGARGFAHVGVIKALEEAGSCRTSLPARVPARSSRPLMPAATTASSSNGSRSILSESALIDFSSFRQRLGERRGPAGLREPRDGHRPIEQLAEAFCGRRDAMPAAAKWSFSIAATRGSRCGRRARFPIFSFRRSSTASTISMADSRPRCRCGVARAMGADFRDRGRSHPLARARELAQADLNDADFVIRPETVRTRLLDFTAKLQNMRRARRLARDSAQAIVARLRQKSENWWRSKSPFLRPLTRPRYARTVADDVPVAGDELQRPDRHLLFVRRASVARGGRPTITPTAGASRSSKGRAAASFSTRSRRSTRRSPSWCATTRSTRST